MEKAILFRFYKEPKVCINRLELLKKHNPNIKIFGLYGGNHNDKDKYKNILGKYLDSFYTLQSTDPNRKRRNGDLALQEWYDNKGKNLKWDSIYVVQRDILIFDSLEKIFKDYNNNQVYFSGTTTLDEKIEKQRDRTSTKTEKPKYLQFKKYIKEKYNYTDKLLCCIPMFEILPRMFFEKYGKLKDLELGFIEYRKATYAKILGFDFYHKDLGIYWFQKNEGISPMSGMAIERDKQFILDELRKKDGRRMFHPYYKSW